MSGAVEVNLAEYACQNPVCLMHGVLNGGNISVRCRYGKHGKLLLYCRSCGKAFAATTNSVLFGAHLPPSKIQEIIHHAAEGVGVRATARLLDMHPNTVNGVILKTGAYCGEMMSKMLKHLNMTEFQLDELWSFIKKKNVIAIYKRTKKI